MKNSPRSLFSKLPEKVTGYSLLIACTHLKFSKAVTSKARSTFGSEPISKKKKKKKESSESPEVINNYCLSECLRVIKGTSKNLTLAIFFSNLGNFVVLVIHQI